MRGSMIALTPKKSVPLVSKPKVYESSKDSFQIQSATINLRDLKLVEKMSKGIFTAYLIETNSSSVPKQLLLKLFSFQDEKPSSHFKNELNLIKLSHPNLISIFSNKQEQEARMQGQIQKLSYVLTEYAPHGDLFELITSPNLIWDDKFIRSYFRQLIEGLEYIHSQNIAHLDLKLENLLIGGNYVLKIANFDASHNIKEDKLPSRQGTKNFRAPEIINQSCKNYKAADIFSAGVILFMMKSRGILPFIEGETNQEEDLYDLINTKPELFWKKHSEGQNKEMSWFDPDFQSLFIAMTRRDVTQRASLVEIKDSKWYQGPIYSVKELSSLLQNTFNRIN